MSKEKDRPSEVVIETKRSRTARLPGVRIVATGSTAASEVVRNEDLAAQGYDADWIVQRTGIIERRRAPKDIATSDLAVEAAERCIAASGRDRSEIDLCIVGTYTPDYLMPATACIVQDRLGLAAPAFDLQLACASFMLALISASQYVASGCSKLALVIGADCNSRVINPEDERTFPLFGDAAGAVLVERGEGDQGLLGYAAGSDGSGAKVLYRPMGGTRKPFSTSPEDAGRHFLHMEGRPVFKWAVRMLRESIADALGAAQLTLDDIDLVILHQANQRIITAAASDLGIPPDKLFNNLEKYGNTSAASIPLALDQACAAGRVQRGQRLLLSGFGGGLAWGTAIWQW